MKSGLPPGPVVPPLLGIGEGPPFTPFNHGMLVFGAVFGMMYFGSPTVELELPPLEFPPLSTNDVGDNSITLEKFDPLLTT